MADRLADSAAETDQSATPRRVGWRRLLIRWTIMLSILYLLVILLLGFFQRYLMYHPFREEVISADDAPRGEDLPPVDAVETETDDGVTLHGWYAPAERKIAVSLQTTDESQHEADRWVVLYFSGNGANRKYRTGELALFNELGADVILFDYRGYGENDGRPTEDGLAKDARAMWKFATETCEIPAERMILMGESMGGGVAIGLAAELCQNGTVPGGMILRSTFTSMVDAAAYHYPWLPVRWALLDRYPSIDRIEQVTCPLLHIHGDLDGIVPIEQGRRLYEAAPEESASGIEKRFVELRGIGHNDTLVAGPMLEREIGRFLEDLEDARPIRKHREETQIP